MTAYKRKGWREKKDPATIGKDGNPKAPRHLKASIVSKSRDTLREPLVNKSEESGNHRIGYRWNQKENPGLVLASDKDYKKPSYSEAGEGIYFSPNKDLVIHKYGKDGKNGGHLIKAKLIMNNPLDLGVYDAMYFDGRKVNSGDIVVENFKRGLQGLKPNPEPEIELTRISKKAKNWLLRNGYDSVKGMEGDMWSAPEYVVFDKTQIIIDPQLPAEGLKDHTDPSNLKLIKIQESGHVFETGRPVEFEYIRNTVKSQHPDKERFGQNIEPKGQYMILSRPGSFLPDGWEKGIIRFNNPLVMEWGTTSSEAHGWKKRLSGFFGGKTGKKLTETLISSGYDGIITVDTDTATGIPVTSEIISLKRQGNK